MAKFLEKLLAQSLLTLAAVPGRLIEGTIEREHHENGVYDESGAYESLVLVMLVFSMLIPILCVNSESQVPAEHLNGVCISKKGLFIWQTLKASPQLNHRQCEFGR